MGLAGKCNRRDLLRQMIAALGMGALALKGQGAYAIGRPTRVALATLDLPGGEAFPRSGVPEAMLFELARNTSVEVRTEVPHIPLMDMRLFDFPLVIVAGSRAFPPLPDSHRERLATYLRGGGMLFADDCSGLHDSPFARAVEREVALIFPGSEMQRLDRKHAIYRSFFLVHRVAGRLALKPYVEGIMVGEISPVIFFRNDLMGALQTDATGAYVYEAVPGGEEQRLLAYKFSINLMMYALTLNYKLDATHVRALLKKRRGVYDE